MKKLQEVSKKVFNIIKQETKRQQEMISLIPSENYVSSAVLEATASCLTNKYSEGYPQKRYYPGNFFIDQIEKYCQDKAKEVFSLSNKWKVNVQPYSGSPANLEIYNALLNKNDKILSLKLTHGGHLSHGHKVNISSQIYQIIQYGLTKEGYIDYNNLEKIAFEEKPKIIVSGATAYPRKIDFQKIGKIAKKVNAYHLADISHIAGLVAVGLHPSPFKNSDVVMTTTHKTLRGPRSAVIFSKEKLAAKIDKAVFPGLQGGPHEHIIAAKAVAFEEALDPSFKKYQAQIIKNAQALAEVFKRAQLKLVAGGTDNHLLLIDLKNIIDASQAEKILEKAYILANRNTVPDDVSPFHPTGLRMGTPAVTTRGMKEKEMQEIGSWIVKLLKQQSQPEEVKKQVIKLCRKFPLLYEIQST